jgi:hypothetical protein
MKSINHIMLTTKKINLIMLAIIQVCVNFSVICVLILVLFTTSCLRLDKKKGG